MLKKILAEEYEYTRFFSDYELILKTCDIYKYEYSTERKAERYAKGVMKYVNVTAPFAPLFEKDNHFGSCFFKSGDFYLIKCKKEFVESLKEIDGGRGHFLYTKTVIDESDMWNSGTKLIGKGFNIDSLEDWSNAVYEYFKGYKDRTDNRVSVSGDLRNQVWFIDNLNDIFDNEESRKKGKSTLVPIKYFTSDCPDLIKKNCTVSRMDGIDFKLNFWGEFFYPSHYIRSGSWRVAKKDIGIPDDYNWGDGHYYQIGVKVGPNRNIEELKRKVEDFFWDEYDVTPREFGPFAYIVFIPKLNEERWFGKSLISNLCNEVKNWLFYHRFSEKCSKGRFFEEIQNRVGMHYNYPSYETYKDVYYAIVEICGSHVANKIKINKDINKLVTDDLYQYMDNCYDYWVSKK